MKEASSVQEEESQADAGRSDFGAGGGAHEDTETRNKWHQRQGGTQAGNRAWGHAAPMLRDAKVKCGRGGLLRKLCSPSAFLCEAEHQKGRVLGRGWNVAVAILRCTEGKEGRAWLTWLCTRDLKGSRHRVAAWNV